MLSRGVADRRRAAALAIAAVLMAMAAAVVAARTDPAGATAKGCKCSSLSMQHAPVCAENGFTIINECVALCQGLRVSKPGPCSSGSGSAGGVGAAAASADDPVADFLSPQHIVAGARVGMDVAGKYKKQGYTYVGRVKLSSDKARTPTVASAEAAAVAGTDGHEVIAARITSTGDLYLANTPPPTRGQTPGASRPGRPIRGTAPFSVPLPRNKTRPASRRLAAIYGRDDRYEVDAHSWNYGFTVGYIESGCTGTLIGPSTVLTAGHCVFDDFSRRWKKNLKFYPGLHSGGDHCHDDGCYGYEVIDWDSATSWYVKAPKPPKPGAATNAGMILDFAVIVLKADLSDAYGYMGYGYVCRRTKWTLDTVGYPGTKPWGTQWYTRGVVTFAGCTGMTAASVATSLIDSEPGQSGSALWSYNSDGGPIVRAMHIAAGPKNSFQRTINDAVVNFLSNEVV